MPKLVVSIDDTVVQEVPLMKDRSTIGRRPYNDIVIDHLAVSGEHAAVHLQGAVAVLEDLGSTNGTHVNGQRIQRHVLAHQDAIGIGRHTLHYVAPGTRPAAAPVGAATGPRVCVVNGQGAGREWPLLKPVTTVGKAGIAVAAITRTPQGFELAQIGGDRLATVNGVPADAGPILLRNHARIELDGVRLEFLDR